MKNILIPTNYASDTIQALRITATLKQRTEVRVKMLTASPVSDSIMQLLFLTHYAQPDFEKRDALMKSWDEHKEKHQLNVAIEEHHQYGMSRPIMQQLVERFEIDLVVIPFSFQYSKSHVDQLMLKFLQASSIPLLLLPNEDEAPEDIHRALFLDDNNSVDTNVIESLPFHIIRQSMVRTSGLQSVKSMIDNFRINLIVLNKGDERKFAEPISESKLPILTV